MCSVTPLDPGFWCRRRAGDRPGLPACFTREGQGLVQGLLVAKTPRQGPRAQNSHRHIGMCAQEEMPHTHTFVDYIRGKEALPGAGSWGPSCPAALQPHLPLSVSQGKPVRPPDIVPPPALQSLPQ